MTMTYVANNDNFISTVVGEFDRVRPRRICLRIVVVTREGRLHSSVFTDETLPDFITEDRFENMLLTVCRVHAIGALPRSVT